MATAPKAPKAPDTFDLRRPMGPLPLYAWVIVVGIAAFLYFHRQNEPGWFPSASFAYAPGGDGGLRPGMMWNDGRLERDEEEEGASGGSGFSSLQRESQPSPITAGGADGTAWSDSTTPSGGARQQAGNPVLGSPGNTATNVSINAYVPSGGGGGGKRITTWKSYVK